MLEHPCIRRYSFMSYPLLGCVDMSSENPTGADNQQETVFSGILRDCTPGTARKGCEDTVRSSWRHEESGRNVLTLHFGKPAEMESNNNA
jgi:hypothetical protein